MLIVEGFFENGVFIPKEPLINIKGRQRAVLSIDETDNNEKQKRLNAWQEFSQTIRASDVALEGEPGKICFRTPKNLKPYDRLGSTLT